MHRVTILLEEDMLVIRSGTVENKIVGVSKVKTSKDDSNVPFLKYSSSTMLVETAYVSITNPTIRQNVLHFTILLSNSALPCCAVHALSIGWINDKNPFLIQLGNSTRYNHNR